MSAADAGPDEPFTLTLRGPRVVYGERVAETELLNELMRLDVRRVLLLASEREQAARGDILEPIVDRIVARMPDVRRHVPIAIARAATTLARDVEADCLLSIGGGSAVGTAKAVALETGLPIVALPTTYAGSEVTPVYGITEGAVKRTGRSGLVLPHTVILDPRLTWDLPPDLTRHSAVNALAHCISGVFASGRSPVTDLLAVEGADLIARGLRGIGAEPGSSASRAALTRGAYFAGTVLAHAGTSAHHTICHVLGGSFDLPHAETHAAVLPAAARFLQERDPHAGQRLAATLGAADLASAVHDLLDQVGASVRLRDIGLAAEQLPLGASLLSGSETESGVAGLSEARATQLLTEAW